MIGVLSWLTFETGLCIEAEKGAFLLDILVLVFSLVLNAEFGETVKSSLRCLCSVHLGESGLLYYPRCQMSRA